MVAKRPLSEGHGKVADNHIDKKSRQGGQTGRYNKIATTENAASVDKNPPLQILLDAVADFKNDEEKGDSVVYWMRMEDMRSTLAMEVLLKFTLELIHYMCIVVDNRALSFASEQAKHKQIPLLVLFVISPQDYEAHDRSSRRIDFMLRNLKILKVCKLCDSVCTPTHPSMQSKLEELHIPLYIITHKPRRTLPDKIISLMEDWGSKCLFANISYEVDELRRDIKTCELAKKKHLRCNFVQDKLIVNPGVLATKDGKAYSVIIILTVQTAKQISHWS